MTSALYDSFEEKIATIVQGAEKPVLIYLEGGHYLPNQGPDWFARTTWEGTLDLAQRLVSRFKYDIKITLGIFKDDLGQVCDENFCVLPIKGSGPPEASDAVHQELLDMASKSRLFKRDKLVVSTERAAKNRSITFLRRQLEKLHPLGAMHPDIEYHQEQGEDRLYYKSFDRSSILLSYAKGGAWVAKCSAIMGMHYADMAKIMRKRYNSPNTCILVDCSELYDRNKVCKGSEAALRIFMDQGTLGAGMHIINGFLSGDDPEDWFIDGFDGSEFL